MTARILTALLALGLLPLTALADDPPPSDHARSLRLSGRYGDAEAELRTLLEAEPGDPAAAAELSLLLLETGRLEEIEAVAGPASETPRVATILAESFLTRGRLDRAEEILAKALRTSPDLERARYLEGLIHLERGDRKKAAAAFEWFFDHYATNDLADPEALTCVAEATVRLAELQPDVEMDFHVTMKLLDSVTRGDESYLPAYAAKGELYLAVYQDQDAKKWFDKALKKNPRYPPALLGLAKQSAYRFNEVGGVNHCREALLTNPNLFEAKEFIASTKIGDSEYDEARKLLDEILAVNPERKPARALLAVIDFLLGDRDGFQKRVDGILADDPRYAGVFIQLTGALSQQRRFEEASVWAKKATETDPDDYMAFWLLGQNLVHLAKETEARAALQQSRALDPYAHYSGNPFRENMVEVLGHLEEFVETRTPNFVYKVHVGESAILTKYYHRFMERSWRLLTEKYGFTPEGPILTEIFHIHADFAARTIGLPGIGALGACFGKVITLDSPSSRRPGEFTWASTAHHEFAHVMTLQLSKGRVPRWFTEGLSVYEERKLARWWERDMDRRLFDAYHNDEIPPIATFNAEFRGGDVLFAYYLGGMMCEFIEAEFGFSKIITMLTAYGEDKQTPAVLTDVLGVTPEEFDSRFKAWVGRYVGGWKLMPRASKKTVDRLKAKAGENPKDLDTLTALAWAYFHRGNSVDAMTWLGKALAVDGDDPRLMLLRGEIAFRAGRLDKAKEWFTAYLDTGEEDLFARLKLAGILESEGEYEKAVKQYELGKLCFPRYAEQGNAYEALAKLKEGAGDLDGSMAEVEALVLLRNTDIPNRLKLADYYEGKGDWKKLAEILGQVVEIYPLGEKSAMPVHVRLARALSRLSEPEAAAIEYEVALELGIVRDEEAGVRVELGETYFLLGRIADARHQAKTALEIAPDLAPANVLIEKIQNR